MAITQIRLLML